MSKEVHEQNRRSNNPNDDSSNTNTTTSTSSERSPSPKKSHDRFGKVLLDFLKSNGGVTQENITKLFNAFKANLLNEKGDKEFVGLFAKYSLSEQVKILWRANAALESKLDDKSEQCIADAVKELHKNNQVDKAQAIITELFRLEIEEKGSSNFFRGGNSFARDIVGLIASDTKANAVSLFSGLIQHILNSRKLLSSSLQNSLKKANGKVLSEKLKTKLQKKDDGVTYCNALYAANLEGLLKKFVTILEGDPVARMLNKAFKKSLPANVSIANAKDNLLSIYVNLTLVKAHCICLKQKSSSLFGFESAAIVKMLVLLQNAAITPSHTEVKESDIKRMQSEKGRVLQALRVVYNQYAAGILKSGDLLVKSCNKVADQLNTITFTQQLPRLINIIRERDRRLVELLQFPITTRLGNSLMILGHKLEGASEGHLIDSTHKSLFNNVLVKIKAFIARDFEPQINHLNANCTLGLSPEQINKMLIIAKSAIVHIEELNTIVKSIKQTDGKRGRNDSSDFYTDLANDLHSQVQSIIAVMKTLDEHVYPQSLTALKQLKERAEEVLNKPENIKLLVGNSNNEQSNSIQQWSVKTRSMGRQTSNLERHSSFGFSTKAHIELSSGVSTVAGLLGLDVIQAKLAVLHDKLSGSQQKEVSLLIDSIKMINVGLEKKPDVINDSTSEKFKQKEDAPMVAPTRRRR